MQQIIKTKLHALQLSTFSIVVMIMVLSCRSKNVELPILGEMTISGSDTIYHTIRPFEFRDQKNNLINNDSLANQIYIADFFFTHCPSICPKVTHQLKRVYDQFEDEDRLHIVSFTLDPKRDSIARLDDYANKLGVSADKWSFLTGPKDTIWSLAADYFSVAVDDDEAAGGINHSGRIILIDTKGRVRSYCQGTEEKSVDQFIKDIHVLLNSMD